MAPTLPDIGRNGLVNSVRRLSGLTNPGYRAVDSAASFIAGMVAVLGADANGNPVLKVADNTSDGDVIGLFYCHKTVNFYRPIVAEEQTFGDSPNTAVIAYLSNANIKADSIMVSSTGDMSALFTEDTDWEVGSLVNGYINNLGVGIAADQTVYVSYLYEDPNLTGIDQTLGSGLAATLEDHGEIATLVYDTSAPFALNGDVVINADGYLSYAGAAGAVGSKVVGRVTKAPTSEDPELRFKLTV